MLRKALGHRSQGCWFASDPKGFPRAQAGASPFKAQGNQEVNAKEMARPASLETDG
jgi:hypothetical protein